MEFRYLVYGLKIKSQIDFDEFVKIDKECDYDVEILYGNMSKKISNEIEAGRKVFTSKERVWFHINKIANYLVENGNKITVEVYENVELKDIKSYIVGTCLGYLLYQKNILAIHGGALELNNKALVIVGESGAGKSTLTTALRLKGLGFLADDISAIDINGYPMVHPGYPGQRLCDDGMKKFNYNTSDYPRIELDDKIKYTIPVWENFTKDKVKIGAIFEITIGDIAKVEIEKVVGSEKLNLLLRNVYCLNSIKHLGVSSDYFLKCVNLAKEVDMYKIIRPRNKFTVDEQIKLIEDKINNLEVEHMLAI